MALGVELTDQGGRPLVDEGLDLVIGNVGYFDAEEVPSLGENSGEVTEEEDSMEDCCC